MWETWIYDTITGNLLHQVYPASSPWSTSLLGDGEANTVFQIGDADAAWNPAKVESYFRPNQRGIAHLWGNHVSYAGKIQYWDHDRDAGTVTVKSAELRSEAAWRLTYGVNQYTNGTLIIANKSHAAAAGLVLQRFMLWSADWKYPIDLPSLTTAGTFSATWPYWKKLWISDLLEQIEAEGYEIYLRPKRVGNQIRYDVIVQPRIRTGNEVFILGAEESPLLGVKFKVSGESEITGLQGLGEGMGEQTPHAEAGASNAAGKPVRDTTKTFADLEGARLQAATQAAVEAASNPIRQLTVNAFQASDKFSAALATPGAGWTVIAKDELAIPDGEHVLRVIRTTGDITSMQIQTETQYATT